MFSVSNAKSLAIEMFDVNALSYNKILYGLSYFIYLLKNIVYLNFNGVSLYTLLK